MAKKYDPWKDMVTVRLPKAAKSEENNQFVGVNGKFYQVPRGRAVQVPRPVYDALADAASMADKADEYARKVEEKREM